MSQDPTRHPGTPDVEPPATSEETDAERDGDMGVSSERVGPTGPGQHAPSGVRDVGPDHATDRDDLPPEQSSGGEETNPVGLPPKAGYSSTDPRSKD